MRIVENSRVEGSVEIFNILLHKKKIGISSKNNKLIKLNYS